MVWNGMSQEMHTWSMKAQSLKLDLYDLNKYSIKTRILSQTSILYLIRNVSTPYNRIENSTRIRQTRDGQREGLLRIKFEDIFK